MLRPYVRRRTSEALIPPKPNQLVSTISGAAARASRGRRSRSQAGAGRPRVGASGLVGGRGGDVFGVVGEGAAGADGGEGGAVVEGALPQLQHQRRRALTHDEAAPTLVEGTGRVGWVVVAGTHRP